LIIYTVQYNIPVRTKIRMSDDNEQQQQSVSALQDLIAGGVAGSVSVIIGHPFDTYKVRLQTSNASSPTTAASFGGVSSLFRGMLPPLSTAAVVNALIFSSYGESSRIWDEYFYPVNGGNSNGNGNGKNVDNSSSNNGNVSDSNHEIKDSKWLKGFFCGSFAGAVQAMVICPSEHVKCRLQIQHGIGCTDNIFKGPFDAVEKIISSHGIKGLYRGLACTGWREIPAFGLYFSTYDFVKETVTTFISEKESDHDHDNSDNYIASIENNSIHQWAASALAGGCSGAFTWAAIYPFDVVKTRIQTSPLDTPIEKRRMSYMFRTIFNQHGPQYFFRGLGVTLLRAFPVNAIIFPVYEFILSELTQRGIGNFKSDHNTVEPL
jgi:solute carrier family 25 carnitine/acylcarnitine transporter 20/29